jgi:hypothetical protein B2_09748
MQQPLEDEYLKRKTTNPPKDPAKGSHENSEPPDNPARVTNGQNKKKPRSVHYKQLRGFPPRFLANLKLYIYYYLILSILLIIKLCFIYEIK